jgi:hypothetical protein
MLTSKVEINAVSSVDKVGSRKEHGQFNHVQTFPRKLSALSGKARKDKSGNLIERKIARQWTVSEIAKEAYREDDNCRHVRNPLASILVKGAPIEMLEHLCDEMMSQARQADGKRAVRSDVHVLIGAVYSLPYRPDDYVEYKDRCDAFIADAMAWHEKTYGPIASAILHLDENMVHWHVYTLDADARNKIPGWKAKREEIKRLEALGVDKKEAIRQGNFLYRDAMKKLQDDFFIEVGEINGLARYGDRRMRYQPGEAHLKRAEREAHAAALRKAREVEDAIRKKIEEDRAETIKKNLQAAEEAFEAQQERLRAEHMSEYIDREKKRVREARLRLRREIENLLETPEYEQQMLIKRLEEKVEALGKKNHSLREEVAMQSRSILKLEKENRSLRSRLKQLRQTVRRVISKLREKISGIFGRKNEFKR